MLLSKFFSSITTSFYDKKISRMEEKGLCPECNGNGVMTFPAEFIYIPPNDCFRCEGTGSFDIWEANKIKS